MRNAVKKAGKTVKHMDGFAVVESLGEIHDGKIAFWQVTIKIGCRLED